MRYISLFSGIEAASVAWAPLGWEPVAFSEIEPFPCAVLEQRFPDVPNLGDITKINWKEVIDRYGAVDLVVGGSPCQSFSIAGDRSGLAGASGLMFEYIRAVQEIMPLWFLWENVPGALSSEEGRAFAQLLDAMDELGYELAWRVLDAQFFGVAQRRRRVFLVGHLGGGGGAVSVLFEPEGVRWDYPSSQEKREELAAHARSDVEASGGSAGCMTPWDVQSKRVYSQDGAAPTLSSGTHEGMNIQPIIAVAQNSRNEVRVQGDGTITCALCAQQGMKQQTYISAQKNYALRMRAGKDGGGKGPLVQEEISGTHATGNDQTVFQDGYTVRRLTPLECERLQGFPDGWTKIPFKGKSAEECPDAPRYKALGNSFAVPVVAWIGKRIDLYEKGELNEL